MESIERDVAHKSETTHFVVFPLQHEESIEGLYLLIVGCVEVQIKMAGVAGRPHGADDLAAFEADGQAGYQLVVAIVLVFTNKVEINLHTEAVVQVERGVCFDGEGLFVEVWVVA